MTHMHNRRRARHLAIGTLAEATCKASDWIDGLRWPLERIRLSRADRAAVGKLLREYDALPEPEADNDDDLPCDEILTELIAVAEGYLLPYTTLGTLPGDGACFGVWADIDALEQAHRDGEVWKNCARGDGYGVPGTIRLTVPRGAYRMEVSDHGNVALYRDGREIWGVV